MYVSLSVIDRYVCAYFVHILYSLMMSKQYSKFKILNPTGSYDTCTEY